jgi:hypothetical protein
MLALGCGGSGNSSGGGCGNSRERCDINTTATVCGERITVECFDGATPDAASQCEIALQQDSEAIYCCTSAVAETEGLGAWGGGGVSISDGGGAVAGGAESGGGGFGGTWL